MNVLRRLILTISAMVAISSFASLSSSCGGDAQHSEVEVVVLGDSNSWLGEDDCTSEKGWTRWFADAFKPAGIRSYARSGATLTSTFHTVADTEENIGVLGDNNVIANQIRRLIKAYEESVQPKPEVVIISAGTNDIWFADSRPHALLSVGEADSICGKSHLSSATTIEGAIEQQTDMLRAYFPDAMIVYLTPMQSTKFSVERLADYSIAIEQFAKRHGCVVLRLDIDGCVNREVEKRGFNLTYDGVHTSRKGAQCVGRWVATRLSEILKSRYNN